MIAQSSYSPTEEWRYAARNPSRIDFGSKTCRVPHLSPTLASGECRDPKPISDLLFRSIHLILQVDSRYVTDYAFL